MPDQIRIEGLKELRRDFKRAGDSLPKEIAAINKRLVNQVFVPAARSKAAGRTNPRAGHDVINSIRALGSQTRAQIAGGSKRVAWFAGMEFGSVRYRQFAPRSPRKGRGNAGYFLYPAVYENMPKAISTYQQMLETLLQSKG